MDIDDITLDRLTADQYSLAELIGIEAYKKLVRIYGGSSIYIWKADTIMKNYRNNEICSKFNGFNYRELAKEYNLSEKMIREITSDKLKEIKNMPDEEQLTLFD